MFDTQFLRNPRLSLKILFLPRTDNLCALSTISVHPTHAPILFVVQTNRSGICFGRCFLQQTQQQNQKKYQNREHHKFLIHNPFVSWTGRRATFVYNPHLLSNIETRTDCDPPLVCAKNNFPPRYASEKWMEYRKELINFCFFASWMYYEGTCAVDSLVDRRLKWAFFFPAEYADNGRCHSCHSTCETCMSPTENDCLTCSNNLLLQNNKCVSACDKGFFMEAGICTVCLHTCTQCVSRMNCTECVKGLQLQSGECRATCADGYVNRISSHTVKLNESDESFWWNFNEFNLSDYDDEGRMQDVRSYECDVRWWRGLILRCQIH